MPAAKNIEAIRPSRKWWSIVGYGKPVGSNDDWSFTYREEPVAIDTVGEETKKWDVCVLLQHVLEELVVLHKASPCAAYRCYVGDRDGMRWYERKDEMNYVIGEVWRMLNGAREPNHISETKCAYL